jgi:hypothetical protein
MSNRVFGLPGKEVFQRVEAFVNEKPDAGIKEHLRRFVTKYGDTLTVKQGVSALVDLFAALEEQDYQGN